jgi:hypothetical protein
MGSFGGKLGKLGSKGDRLPGPSLLVRKGSCAARMMQKQKRSLRTISAR